MGSSTYRGNAPFVFNRENIYVFCPQYQVRILRVEEMEELIKHPRQEEDPHSTPIPKQLVDAIFRGPAEIRLDPTKQTDDHATLTRLSEALAAHKQRLQN